MMSASCLLTAGGSSCLRLKPHALRCYRIEMAWSLTNGRGFIDDSSAFVFITLDQLLVDLSAWRWGTISPPERRQGCLEAVVRRDRCERPCDWLPADGTRPRDLFQDRAWRPQSTGGGRVVTEFDPGPPPEFAEIFARVPDYAPFKEHFWYDWGPVFYRGRLDGSARVLCVASDPGPTERVAMRTLVGDAGQRVQGFLARIGLTRSYICLNAFIYALHPSSFWEGRKILRDPELLGWRNELFDKVKGQNLQAIVAFGSQAQDAVSLWDGKDTLPVFEVPHPSSRDPKRLLEAWHEAVVRLREIVTPDPEADPSPSNYGSQFREEDYSRIPPGDLPFGVPDWFGDDAWGRAATPRHNNSVSRPSPDDGHTLTWIAPMTTEFAITSLAAPPSPVGPSISARYALEGRVVTKDASSSVLERGIVYVEGDSIAAVTPTGAASPAGF